MILAVIGSREPSEESVSRLVRILELNFKTGKFTGIVTGGAYGADSIGMEFAIKHNIPLTVYTPKSTLKFNKDLCAKAKEAGKTVNYTCLSFNDRNTLVINDCDIVLCADYGNGTVDALWKAKNQGKRVYTTGTYKQGAYKKTLPKIVKV